MREIFSALRGAVSEPAAQAVVRGLTDGVPLVAEITGRSGVQALVDSPVAMTAGSTVLSRFSGVRSRFGHAVAGMRRGPVRDGALGALTHQHMASITGMHGHVASMARTNAAVSRAAHELFHASDVRVLRNAEGVLATGTAPAVDVLTGAASLAPSAAAHTLTVPVVSPAGIEHLVAISRDGAPFTAGERALAEHYAGSAVGALENAGSHARLADLANTDELTRVPNRRATLETLAEQIGLSSGDRRTGVAMFDIDNFKGVNDTHGHDIGDEVLKAVAGEMHATASAHGGMAGRFGGEEFVMILPHHDEARAATVADEVLERIRGLRVQAHDGTELKLSASAGVTATRIPPIETEAAASVPQAIELSSAAIGRRESDQAATAINRIIKEADDAMYSAKTTGQDRVVTFAG